MKNLWIILLFSFGSLAYAKEPKTLTYAEKIKRELTFGIRDAHESPLTELEDLSSSLLLEEEAMSKDPSISFEFIAKKQQKAFLDTQDLELEDSDLKSKSSKRF